MGKNSKQDKRKSIDLAAQAGAASEVVDRCGSANKEHLVAYSGKDNEFGRTLKRGLKKTAESKVTPEYRDQNLRQQSGFSAEDKYTARQNAKKIIEGSKERYSRTDDLGRVNDPLYDHVVLDENGVEIIGSGEQMKFVGNSPGDCLSKLKSEKYQKYIDADATLTVPSDYFQGILDEADKEIVSLRKQLEYANSTGNTQLFESITTKIKKLEKIKSSLKDSGVSNAEAMEARLHPKWSTAKDIARVSHRAGLEQAKNGAAVAGGISLIRNVVGVCKGDVTPAQAAKTVAVDTAAGATTAYVTAFAGSTIKGAMQNAGSSTVRTLSKTNVPTMIVASTVDVGKSMVKYFNGEISGLECLEELGEKGTSHLSAAMFAGVGQAVIPIPVVGAMVGSMIGYALSSTFYGQLKNALKEEKLSYELRLKAEKESAEAIKLIEQYRREMQEILNRYFQEHTKLFQSAFSQMDNALANNDIDQFIAGANKITHKLGGKTEFSNFSEFDNFMNDDNTTLKF